ncbi:hypothetical protein KFU94_25455 [Chloroflexi bacterium TSY]|nr:hypothetical protein [Chloroflexi bacterium TSY]
MNTQTEAVMGMIAALLVLFSAMIDPWISVVLSLLLLVAFSVYRFLGMRQSR